MKRVRLVAVHVSPQLVVDDGDTLEPVPVQPVTFTAAEWQTAPAKLAELIASLEVDDAP